MIKLGPTVSQIIKNLKLELDLMLVKISDRSFVLNRFQEQACNSCQIAIVQPWLKFTVNREDLHTGCLLEQ